MNKVAKLGEPGYIHWSATPAAKAREKRLIEAENAIQIVRVTLTGDDEEAMVYRKGRVGLKHQNLTPETLAALNGDRAAYFEAQWSNANVEWTILNRTTEHW